MSQSEYANYGEFTNADQNCFVEHPTFQDIAFSLNNEQSLSAGTFSVTLHCRKEIATFRNEFRRQLRSSYVCQL
jgi:hypothetical protein